MGLVVLFPLPWRSSRGTRSGTWTVSCFLDGDRPLLASVSPGLSHGSWPPRCLDTLSWVLLFKRTLRTWDPGGSLSALSHGSADLWDLQLQCNLVSSEPCQLSLSPSLSLLPILQTVEVKGWWALQPCASCCHPGVMLPHPCVTFSSLMTSRLVRALMSRCWRHAWLGLCSHKASLWTHSYNVLRKLPGYSRTKDYKTQK